MGKSNNSKVGSKSSAALSSQSGIKSITSFFSPKAKPAFEVETTPKMSPPECLQKSREARTPLQSKSHTVLDDAGSSSLKTRSKPRSPLGKCSQECKDDSGLDDEWGPVARKIVTDEAAIQFSEPALIPLIGGIVEVLFDGGKWYRGKLVSQNNSGSWHVEFDDGDETDISFPDPEVRLIPSSDKQRPQRVAASRRKRLAPETSDDDNDDTKAHTPSAAEDARGKRARRSRVRPAESASASEEEEYNMEEVTSSESDEELDDIEGESDSNMSDGPRRRGGKETRKRNSAPRPRKGAREARQPDTTATLPQDQDGKAAYSGNRAAEPARASTSGSRCLDRHIVSEQKKEKAAKFEAKNHERCEKLFDSTSFAHDDFYCLCRYRWLEDVRDAQGRRPTDEGYDARTLLVPKV